MHASLNGRAGISELPAPAFAGGSRALTTTPVVGSPSREYPEVFVPGEEPLADGELRVTVLGSGNPWVTRAQSSGGILVEVGKCGLGAGLGPQTSAG